MHNEELRNPHVRHETGDINAGFLTKFGLSMMFTIVVFVFALWGMFSYLKGVELQDQPKPRPGADLTAHREPPEPRLQAYPVRDFEQFVKTENEHMNQYAWLDPDKGTVRIPVDVAMQAMLKKGFGTVPEGGRKPQ